MIAFTAEKVPQINEIVDHVNVSQIPRFRPRNWKKTTNLPPRS